MSGRIADFLTRMSNIPVKSLPLVHTTPAYNLRRIFDSKQIQTSPCAFFGGEELCYFFFGRPAYKWDTEGEASDWELPVCFVFEYDLFDSHRIFPFDSGAFHDGRLPHYLTMMPLEEFEIGNVVNSPSKLVAAYFSSPSEYYALKCKPEDMFMDSYSVDAIESEVRALHRLYAEHNPRADDRRATVEVQYASNISLEQRRLIALILPDIYLANPKVVSYARQHKVELLSYDTFPLNAKAYIAIIYHKVKEFYRTKGYIRR